MVIFGVRGLIEVPSHRPVRAEYHADSYQRCAIKMLERHGPNAGTASHKATQPPAAMASNSGGAVLHVARKRGVCALSGQTIAPGDAVYRPRLAQPAPRNIEAMILASVMEAIPQPDFV